MEDDTEIKRIDFSGFEFPNPISFENRLFEKKVIFSNAIFKKSASFSNAEFTNDVFFDEVEFKDAFFNDTKFNNYTSFYSTIFDPAYFQGAKFKNVDFSYAIFKVAYFRSSQFNDEASFEKAEFYSNADFVKTTFNNDVDFILTSFDNKVDFSNTKFNNAYFIDTKFNNEANFSNSEFKKDAIFRNPQFSSPNDLINFRYAKFYDQKHIRFQKINLSRVTFLNTDITEVEFLDEIWPKKGGRVMVVDEMHIGRDQSTTYSAIAQLYRRLRKNYENNYRFAEAGSFFIGEMEMFRLDVDTRFKNETIRKMVLWFKRNLSILGFYRNMSLYGEDYSRPAIIAILVIFFYPIAVNLLFHLIFNSPLINYQDYFSLFRSSFSSFFQMDTSYLGERLIGILIIGLFFIALKRKFERKR
jgi:uncharacterized protein YjbI with pentapeptide repeats